MLYRNPFPASTLGGDNDKSVLHRIRGLVYHRDRALFTLAGLAESCLAHNRSRGRKHPYPESERQDRATDKVYTSKNFEHTLYGRYAFVVNGQRYLSRERRLDSTTNKNPVASFAVQAGDTISVRYDPDDPNRNRPEDDAPVGTAILMLVIGLLTMLTSGWFARA